MKKKVIGIALAVLAIGGVALASGTGQFITTFIPYTQVQSIAQSNGYPINVYKTVDGSTNCYISVVGQGAASISCVSSK